MSFADENIPMLRILIDDVATPQEYSDEDLTSSLVVAAKLVEADIRTGLYTISSANNTISPDPQSSGDVVFMNLMVMRAACLIDQGNLRQRAMLEGVRANCGPSSISVSGAASALLDIIKIGYCKTYSDLKKDFMYNNLAHIRGIFGPFVSNVFDPCSLGRNNNARNGDMFR